MPAGLKLRPPLLVGADSGFSSKALMQSIAAQGVALKREIALIIKWNPRTVPVEAIAATRTTDASMVWVSACRGQAAMHLDGCA